MTQDTPHKDIEELRQQILNIIDEKRSRYLVSVALAEFITTHTERAVQYDPNRLGNWVFVGDNEHLKTLDALYWSYVSEIMASNNGRRPYTRVGTPKADLKYFKSNMKYASFNEVGLRLTLARADQRAKEKIIDLQKGTNHV